MEKTEFMEARLVFRVGGPSESAGSGQPDRVNLPEVTPRPADELNALSGALASDLSKPEPRELPSWEARVLVKRANDAGETHLGLDCSRIDPHAAAALVEFKGNVIVFRELVSMDARTAVILATFKGKILIMSTLDRRSEAIWLEESEAKLFDPEFAREIVESGEAAFSRLNRLKGIDVAAAVELIKLKGGALGLSGLVSLDAATAEVLARFKGRTLMLNGLVSLDVATARALAKYEGRIIQLTGLTRMDDETVSALAKFKGKVFLTGLDAESELRWAEAREALHLPY